MTNELIWVNEADEVVGYGEKLLTHRERRLHRAFSVYLYDAGKRQLLLQKRAENKYHSGGLWSNACCSHPYRQESFSQSIRRCMRDELGVAPRIAEITYKGREWPENTRIPCEDGVLLFAGQYLYRASFGELGEDEIDSVFLFCPDDAFLSMITPNPLEVAELRWFSPEALDEVMEGSPGRFSRWFSGTYRLIKALLCQSWEGKIPRQTDGAAPCDGQGQPPGTGA